VAEISPIRCALDLRDVPPSAFRMPNDGRQWRHKCELRCALLHWLATFADADGSNVEAGIKRMEARFEVSRRTIFRRLDDLIELGFTNREKLTGFKGTRRRTINVKAVLKKAAVVPPSPAVAEVPSSHPVVPSTQVSVVPSSSAEVPSSHSVVPSSHPVVPKSAGFGTQPYLTVPTDQPPFQTGTVGRLEGWLQKNQATMGVVVANTDENKWLKQQVETYTESTVVEALEKYLHRPKGLGGIKNHWAMLRKEFPAYVALASQEARDAAAKLKLEAATEVLVAQQMTEHSAFMESEPPATIGECEPEIEE
jgi:hypothetical protein